MMATAMMAMARSAITMVAVENFFSGKDAGALVMVGRELLDS
jgi:hypothetical protein